MYGIFTRVGEVSEISLFAALTRSISDTAPTRVKIPYARAFHEVISKSDDDFHRAERAAEERNREI